MMCFLQIEQKIIFEESIQELEILKFFKKRSECTKC